MIGMETRKRSEGDQTDHENNISFLFSKVTSYEGVFTMKISLRVGSPCNSVFAKTTGVLTQNFPNPYKATSQCNVEKEEERTEKQRILLIERDDGAWNWEPFLGTTLARQQQEARPLPQISLPTIFLSLPEIPLFLLPLMAALFSF